MILGANEHWEQGLLSTFVGMLEWLAGEPEAAETLLKQAVQLHDRIGETSGIATSLAGLAHTTCIRTAVEPP